MGKKSPNKSGAGTPNWPFVLIGGFFGFALSRSGATEYNLIHDLFRFRNLKLMYLMGLAIVVGAFGMVVIRATGDHTLAGERLQIRKAPTGWNNVYGGLVFGAGWALAGACPGTVLGQVGEGKLYSLFTFVGLLAGTYVYALMAESRESREECGERESRGERRAKGHDCERLSQVREDSHSKMLNAPITNDRKGV